MKKILVVEDELAYLKLLNSQLTERGCQVIEAMDGKRGLEKAKSENPDPTSFLILDSRSWMGWLCLIYYVNSRAAKLLGVSVEDVRVLEEKGLLHSGSPEEIARIKAKKGMTVAEAAGLVDAEIQRKTVSSVSLFQKVLRVIGGFLAGYIALVMVAGIFFLTYPLQASDFFGYYYRYNAPEKNGKVLAAATGRLLFLITPRFWLMC